MDKDTFLSKITEIGTCEDEVTRRSMLDELRGEATALYDSNAELTTSNNALTAANDYLRGENMKLFVQLGTEKDPEDQPPQPQPEEKRKFEDLFEKKGVLK